ncbi:SPW repeat protein [Modicisalibacter tunisiensis]|uniref:SPW repeat protein n=1 Tax=Modicisalibacter tunisiensis TaxID=390637 RepID=A0ABS7WUQ8_9GAMM|nr:SPW repeat protein [Modicisalibacter tunisiensis]MBZ9566341.1 SPW repeat protein [Modicisalibacter tunisiensis]
MKTAQLHSRWRDRIMLLFGAWLAVSPYVLGFAATASLAMWSTLVVGLALIAMSALAIWKQKPWEEWLLLALGVWLLAAPFVLGFLGLTNAALNSFVMGVLVGGDAIWSLIEMKGSGRGHGGRPA